MSCHHGVACYFSNASPEFGSNLTASGVYGGSLTPANVTLPGGSAGVNNGLRISDNVQYRGLTTQDSYIAEFTANITSPASNPGAVYGLSNANFGGISLYMRATGLMYLNHQSTAGVSTNSSNTAGSHELSEKHYAVVYNGREAWAKLFIDGTEEIDFDLSGQEIGPHEINSMGFGCTHFSQSEQTCAMTVRRIGCLIFKGTIDSRWKGIVAAMNAAKAGTLPIEYRA